MKKKTELYNCVGPFFSGPEIVTFESFYKPIMKFDFHVFMCGSVRIPFQLLSDSKCIFTTNVLSSHKNDSNNICARAPSCCLVGITNSPAKIVWKPSHPIMAAVKLEAN